MMQPHGPLLCFRLLHIFNGLVSTSLVGSLLMSSTERNRMEWPGVGWNYSGVKGFDNKIGNNLGLSSCTVPQSAVVCVVVSYDGK